MKLSKLLSALALLAGPLVVHGQLTTVFQDTFQSGNLSALNPTATTYTSPTTNKTWYCIGSSKGANASTAISVGALTLATPATSSGYTEAAAQFTTSPVNLSASNQYVEVQYTFTDTANVFNGYANNNEELIIGLYNSGTSGPTNGTLLWSSGLASGSSTAASGACKSWVGYTAGLSFSSNSAYGSVIASRPAQTGANNLNQALGYNSGYASGTALSPSLGGVVGQPTLTVGSVYTVDLKITYLTATTCSISNTLYMGVGSTGAVFSAGSWTGTFGDTITSPLTTSFDSLEIGIRPTGNAAATTLPVSRVTVLQGIPLAPVITGPASVTVVAGNSTNLAPVISAVPAAVYQWQLNGVNITGATNATLALNNVTAGQSGNVYSLIATNYLGMTTNSTTLTVTVPPSIAGLYNQSATVGDTVTLSPTVSGSPTPTDRWQLNGVDLADGLDANGSTLTGSTTATLTIANAQAGDSGTYSLIASNSAGLVTNSLTLTVAADNIAPVISGLGNQTVVQGSNATFTASVSGVPAPTLQWLDPTGTPIPGATGSSLTISNVVFAQNGSIYSLVASNSVQAVTNTATLYVLVPVAITNQPVSLTVTNTQAASFTVVAGGVPAPTYQWYFNNSPLTGATAATYSLASASPANMGAYFVVVSNSVNTVTSAVATLTVDSTMGYSLLQPANNATNVCYDTPLYLTFSTTPVLRAAGTVKIYNITNAATPVDTINLALNVTNNVNYAANVQPYTIGGFTFTNFPAIIGGRRVAIYPHHGLLTSNQTYYVTLDPGVFTDSTGAYFAGISATNAWQFTTKVGGPANVTNLIVAQDNSGDFATVQGAVDAVPANNTTPTLINVRNGLYTEVVNIQSKNNLTLRGQSRTGAVISYANNANLQGSTHARMNFKINANYIALDNLTISNATPQGGAQAEALMIESGAGHTIINNCEVDSLQDTILANINTSQAYFNGSLIKGNFDYIWGGGNLFFTNCELRTVAGVGTGGNLTASRTDNTANGIWPAYNGLSSSNGLAFVNCQLTRSDATVLLCSMADANGTTNGVAAFIECSLDACYTNASSVAQNSQLLWTYGCSNLNNTVSLNNTAAPFLGFVQLTSGDARLTAAANATNWLYGWQPQLAPNILAAPTPQTVGYGSNATFTVSATGIPTPTYQWQWNGNPVDGATNATLTVVASTATAGAYSVVVTTPAGSATSASASLTVNPAPLTITANDRTKYAGQTVNFAGTEFTPTGLVNGDSVSGVTLTSSGAGSAAATGTYAIVPSAATGTGLGNYTITYVNGTLTVLPPGTNTVAGLTTGTSAALTAHGLAGYTYVLQRTTDLTSGVWVNVATNLADTNGVIQASDPYRDLGGTPPTQAFYRFVWNP